MDFSTPYAHLAWAGLQIVALLVLGAVIAVVSERTARRSNDQTPRTSRLSHVGHVLISAAVLAVIVTSSWSTATRPDITQERIGAEASHEFTKRARTAADTAPASSLAPWSRTAIPFEFVDHTLWATKSLGSRYHVYTDRGATQALTQEQYQELLETYESRRP